MCEGDMSTMIVILAATLPMVVCDQDARNQLFNGNLGENYSVLAFYTGPYRRQGDSNLNLFLRGMAWLRTQNYYWSEPPVVLTALGQRGHS